MDREINFYCRACGNGFLLAGPPFPENSHCEKCDLDYPLNPRAIGAPDDPVRICPRCGGEEFYIQKDFNRNLGLVITILAALSVYLVFGLTWKSLVGLLVIAALDAVLYHVLPLITLCYRCKTIFRGFPLNPDHQAFDLHIGETYRKDG
ncbi:hypothetical protein HY522_02100 [bacterium]|nr:hypothetical protein [bacterium]